MKPKAKLLFIAIFTALSSQAATTYYVKSDGNDSNSGLSDQLAWKTVAQVNTQSFTSGDRILFKRNDLWRATLVPPTNDLTIGAYGDGALPIISGAEPITGLRAKDGQSIGDANRWTMTLATNPVQLFVNDRRGQRMTTAAEVTKKYRWHWDAVTQLLTVCAVGPKAPRIEASVRDFCVDLNGRSGLILEQLRVERAGFTGIRADRLDRSTIQHCEIKGCYINGIRAGERDRHTDISILHNHVSDCGGVGIGFGGRLDNWVIADNEVIACGVLTADIIGCGDKREAAFAWTSGIKIWGWGGDGWVGRYTICNNLVRDSKPVSWAPSPTGCHGNGIWCDEVLKPTARPKICSNRVVNCFAHGVYLEKTDDHDVFNNVIDQCAQVIYTGALEAQSNPFGFDILHNCPDNQAPRKVRGNRLFHNTAIGGWWSMSVSCSSPDCSISDTEVHDNICIGANGKSASLYLYGGGANDGTHGCGNTYLNNSFGPEGGSWVWGSAVYLSYPAFEAASGGAIAKSVQGSPLFVDPPRGNFHLHSTSPGSRAASTGNDLGALDMR